MRALLIAIGLMLLAPAAAGQSRAAGGPVLLLEIDGAIGPAMTEYVRDGLAEAKARASPLVILRMDTPGGLDAATRDIVGDVLASPTPVAVYVAPAGARAASAGTYILYASHLAAMAPGTHLGAATPVQLGGSSPLPSDAPASHDEPVTSKDSGPQDAMSAKAVNDAAAYIASLATLQGRNAEWAERAVRQAATLTAEQALKEGVIELRPASVRALLAQADGRRVRVGGVEQVLELSQAQVIAHEAGWRIEALAVITNPNIAYVLLLVGVYGLLFEFMSPGAVGPGVFGAVALVVALFALNLLPVNYAGLALLLLGIGLMTAEALSPSIGALGVGGAAAFALGSLLLFRGSIPEYRLSPGVVLTAAALSLGYFGLALRAALRVRRTTPVVGLATLDGAPGRVLSWTGEHGVVQVRGEAWRARATTPLTPGQRVRVAGRKNLLLAVEPEADTASDPLPDRP